MAASGIIIEDGGFRLEETSIGSSFWDLYGRHKVSHKDGTSSVEWKIISYGITIQEAFNTIILCRMNARNPDVVNFKEFFINYKKEREEVLKSFSLQTINLTKDLIKLKKEIYEQSEEKSGD